jgi:hypothetical protein
MKAGFVAALIEGFEMTLDAALEQIGEGALRREVEELHVHLARLRRRCEEQDIQEATMLVS